MLERYNKEDPKVVFTEQDIQVVKDLHTEFNIPLHPLLEKELNLFTEKGDEYSVEDQVKLRAFIAYAIANINHELFKSEVFTIAVKDNCEKEWFEAQFYLDLEEELNK